MKNHLKTGKTGSFTIGTLQMIDEKIKHVQTILVAPTRELACQINSVISSIGSYMGIKTCLAIGGVSVNDNLREVKATYIHIPLLLKVSTKRLNNIK